MEHAIARRIPQMPAPSADVIEKALAIGDVSKMPAAMRIAYYVASCESVGLNYLTRPFDVLKQRDGTFALYANMRAAEQLRRLHGISVKVVGRELADGLYTVTAQARTQDGRTDEAQGIVPVDGLDGLGRANAYKKAETQAKRRVTFSIVGLGFPSSDDAGGGEYLDLQAGTIGPQRQVPDMTAEKVGAEQAAAELFGDRGLKPAATDGAPLADVKTALAELDLLALELGRPPGDLHRDLLAQAPEGTRRLSEVPLPIIQAAISRLTDAADAQGLGEQEASA